MPPKPDQNQTSSKPNQQVRKNRSCCSFLPSLFVTASIIVVALSFVLYVSVGHQHQYVFDEKELQSIAQKAINEHPNDVDALVRAVVDKVNATYYKHIIQAPYDQREWIFNNAGGAMGAMIVLHASLSEYVIIFGTSIGTEGHTGRFWADDYFTILHGEQWALTPGSLKKEIYRAGDQHHLPYGVAKQYRMPDSCWALEYARGNIVSMMPFGLWDTFFSTVDLHTLWATVRISAVSMFNELLKGKI